MPSVKNRRRNDLLLCGQFLTKDSCNTVKKSGHFFENVALLPPMGRRSADLKPHIYNVKTFSNDGSEKANFCSLVTVAGHSNRGYSNPLWLRNAHAPFFSLHQGRFAFCFFIFSLCRKIGYYIIVIIIGSGQLLFKFYHHPILGLLCGLDGGLGGLLVILAAVVAVLLPFCFCFRFLLLLLVFVAALTFSFFLFFRLNGIWARLKFSGYINELANFSLFFGYIVGLGALL